MYRDNFGKKKYILQENKSNTPGVKKKGLTVEVTIQLINHNSNLF